MKKLPAVTALALFYVSSTVFAASPWLDGFNEIRIDEASDKKVGDTFLQAVEFIMETAQIDGFAYQDEGILRTEIIIDTRSDVHIVKITVTGYLDDSIKGNVIKAIIDPIENLYYIREVGVQNICARGDNAGKAQATPCP